ncbi:MAG TPA: FAD-dependent oxidoreductase [Longimicrobium sp.]|jgi:monoamine oxidase
MADEEVDVAIVGAGVSGVYSAWRLKRADPSRRIVVFEGGNHVGGRLLSVRPPDIKDMVAELGGMRILPAVQPLIRKLLQALNDELPAGQQIETYDFPVDKPQNIAYLRGVHLRNSDFTTNPRKVPYHLSFLERGGTAGSIIINAIEQIVPGITSPGLSEQQRREMVKGATFAGLPLYQQGFWNVLLRVISCEGYELGVDAGGYNSTLFNWNAADAIPWYLSDFGVDARYKGFKQGFQQVPLSLAQLFGPDGIRLDTRVDGFDAAGDGFELRVGGKTVRAGTLILAMPRRSLDLLAPASPPLQEIRELISSVTPRPLFKLFTTYSNPWWRSAGSAGPDGKFIPVESGRSVTDLPVRQTYYWPNDDGTPATEGPAMLMASYDDGTNIGYWDGFRPRRRQAWQEGKEVADVEEPHLGDDCEGHPDLAWCQYKAPRRMVKEVARQLGIIHGLSYTPDVRNAAFRDWGDDPFGGGWNSWNIGVQSWDVKERIVQPFDGRALYICGEAYSDAQGWVEGALQTADMMLAKLGLAPL